MTTRFKIDHSYIYFFGLALMVVALPLSKFLMSCAQFILVINWFIEGQYKRKINEFFHNKAALVLVSLYILHVIGLIYTSDFDYALKDLRTKLPLLALPVIISTTAPLSKKRFNLLILIYVAAVLIGTLVSSYILLTKPIIDIRDISVFISHIRFSLNICLAVFALLYLLYKEKEFRAVLRYSIGILIAWFIISLFLFESMTGLFILIVTSILISLHFLVRRSNIYFKLGFVLVVIAIAIVSLIIIKNIVDEVYHVDPVDFSTLEERTPYGHRYEHDTLRSSVENGTYVWIYICMPELREEWNRRSSFEFDSLDMKSQHLSYTLIRFLASKALRKDKDGLSQLTDEEIRMVERGIANVKYEDKSSIMSRIHKIVWEYKNVQETNDPSGHSVLQRLEFWKASLGIIKRNPIIGVGTGDMNTAFDDQYERMNSPLEEIYQWRSHNQFLSIFVGFGIIGLLWFIFSLIYPPLILNKFNDYFYLVFFIIAVLSMLNEDTIESQAGVTFFAFFNSLFLFRK